MMAPVSCPWVELVNKRKKTRHILIDHNPALDADDVTASTMGGNIRIGAHCLLGAVKLIGEQMDTFIHSVGDGDSVIKSWELK